MKRVQVGLVMLAAGLLGGLIPLALADEVHGAIWEVHRVDTDKKWRFRAGPKGVVWTAKSSGLPEKMGTWSQQGPKAIMIIDANPEKFGPKRKITIVKVGKNPPSYQGEVEVLETGEKAPLKVKLIKD